MWYTYFMKEDIKNAERAILFAQQVRRMHARRTPTNSKRRNNDIELGITRLHEAMKPIRAMTAKARFQPFNSISAEQRELVQSVSLRLQTERRKLWKLKKVNKNAKREEAA